ncbi:MAG: hypothetical protein AB7L92_05155 [Alphaproteobacteria bacterium]
MSDNQQGISWGKIIKGAAITAGATAAIAVGADFLIDMVGSADPASIQALQAGNETLQNLQTTQDSLQAAAEGSKGLASSVASATAEPAATVAAPAAEMIGPPAPAAAAPQSPAVAALNTASSEIEAASKAMDPLIQNAKENVGTLSKAVSEGNTGIAGNAAKLLNWMDNNKLAAAGIGAGVGGLIAAAASSKGAQQAEAQAEQTSFAEREALRGVQALALARMQAQGYQPAMAMNQQMMR